MFTGIVQGQATLSLKTTKKASSSFTFRFPEKALVGVEQGASIAINGTCLTVTEFNIEKSTASFDAIEQTLRLTNLGILEKGNNVNFERAAKFGDEIGGHLMSGHIYTSLCIHQIQKTEENFRIYFPLTNEIRPYIFNKGFIGLNGCSLTIAEVTDEVFGVHLIPETLAMTTFGQSSEKDLINVEIDSQTQSFVDTVERIMSLKKY